MKINFLKEYPIYLAVKFLAIFFQVLPLGISLAIGRKLGMLGIYLNPKRKCIAYANLKCALGRKYVPSQIRRVLKQAYRNMGQGIIETLLLPKIDKAHAERNFTFENFDNIDNALKKGKGVILLTPHFGNWEMANAALPFKGYIYKAIAREQKPYLLNRLLNKYRESHGCKIISKGMPIREIIKALRNNEIVGMLVDQDAGKSGIFVDFFNMPASWHRGVMELALATGARIVPGFIIRQEGAKFKLTVREPIVFPQTGSKEEKIKEGFSQYIKYIEEIISRHPEQWLWQHKRWKSSPQKRVLILNDTRTGHLRQSQAVLFQLQNLYQNRGLSKDDIIAEVVDVKFKNNITRQALYFTSHFSTRSCQGCMACLKCCLNEQNYKRVSSLYADIIISSGAKTAPVNLALSRECNAKSIVIMNPGAFLLKKFNLAIIPRHDRPKISKGVVVTEGAPNLIDKDLIRHQADSLRYEIGPLSDFKIGLLLGGNHKEFNLKEDAIFLLIEKIEESAQALSADVLVTTSRRTPKNIEALLKRRLANNPRCKLLVIANEKNKEGVVGGILGLCDVVIVSPESISMVSEAASSGAYILVFGAQDITDKRHKLFLKNLSSQGYIQPVDLKDISGHINRFLNGRPEKNILDDSIVIRKGLEKIL
jgi:Kdo2-lipid IVA lauroyltransferase/acyltransferase